MKSDTYIAAMNVISPLGFTSEENFGQLKQMKTGVLVHDDPQLYFEPVCAALIDSDRLRSEFKKLNTDISYTRLEQLMILSIESVIKQNPKIDVKSERTLLVISTTKGNIDLLEPANLKKFDKDRKMIWKTADMIATHFKNPNTPLVVSNACISGVLAIILGKRMLDSSQYDSIIVSGVDILTNFVVSGFESFKAVSKEVCKPYDASRDGISLGEGCGTMVLTNDKSLLNDDSVIVVKGGSSSNDANHISGPSRTGDGLLLAISNTLEEAGIPASEIDYISGHGTATLFNDEMESLAMADAHLSDVPLNSLKSYFGHTLGAAGIIESIMAIHSMKENTLIGTYNYKEPGVTKPLNVITKTTSAEIVNCLKTAAGFGGCNAAVLFQKQ